MKWNLLKNKNGDASVIGVVIAILVSITIGMLVYFTITGSIHTSDASAIAALSNVNSTAIMVFNLAPIVVIVLIAGVVLYYVTRFGGGGAST